MPSIPFDGSLATKSALPRAARQVNTAGCFNCVPPVIPAAHPSVPRSLSPAPIGERESIPQLTRLSHQACPRPRPGSGNPSRRSPIIPAKLVPGPGPGRGAGVHPAAPPSFPRSLSPTQIGEREYIPPLTRHSRENGNPCVLDVGLPLDKPKVHGKTGVVAITKRPPPRPKLPTPRPCPLR